MKTLRFLEPSGPLCAALVRDVCGLIDLDLDPAHVIDWTPNELLMAYDYAMREHLHASDNRAVRRRPRPLFVSLAAREVR